MKSISLRNVPNDIYQGLQAMAKANRRSLQEQIKHLLETEVKLINGSTVSKAAEWRKRLKDRTHTDTLQFIREDRDR